MAVNGTFKWIASGLLTIVFAVSGIIAKDIKDSTVSNHDAVDTVNTRVDSLAAVLYKHVVDVEAERRIQNFQMAEIAKAVGAKVVVDTTNSKDTIQ